MLSQWFLSRTASMDARAGLDSVEDRIIADLGPRPVLNPAGNPEHARHVAALDQTRIEELRDDKTRVENALQGETSPLVLTAGLVAAFLVELLGAVLVTRAMGIAASERLPIGFALAAAVFGLTAATAHRTVAVMPAAGDERPPQGAARSLWSVLVFIAYALLIAAVAAVRFLSAADDEASELGLAADALIMIATALGPAWIAEGLMRRRSLAVRAFGLLRALRRRLREAERARVRAQAAIERIGREGVRWDAEAARRRAAYRAAHRLATASRGTQVETDQGNTGTEGLPDPAARDRRDRT